MVKNILSAFLITFLAQSAFAAHLPPRKVTDVRIGETGKSEDESEHIRESCRDFKITVDEVKAFFSDAYPVPLKLIVHDRYSPCYAKGFIEFSNDTRGEWKIYSSGGGTLLWDTGDSVTLYYNNYTWTDPFTETYAPGDEI